MCGNGQMRSLCKVLLEIVVVPGKCYTSAGNKPAHTVMSSWRAHLPVEDNAPDEAQGQFVVSIHNVRAANVDQINLEVRHIGNDVNVPAYNQQQRIKLHKYTLKSIFAATQFVFSYPQAVHTIQRQDPRRAADSSITLQDDKGTKLKMRSKFKYWDEALNLFSLPIISVLRHCRRLFCSTIYMCEAAAEPALIQLSERQLSAWHH